MRHTSHGILDPLVWISIFLYETIGIYALKAALEFSSCCWNYINLADTVQYKCIE